MTRKYPTKSRGIFITDENKKDTQAVNDKLFIEKIVIMETNEPVESVITDIYGCVCLSVCLFLCVSLRGRHDAGYTCEEKNRKRKEKRLIRFQSLRHKRGRHIMKMR